MENVNINTSQNVLINYKLAGIGDRILAHMIDAVIIFAYYVFVMLIFSGSLFLFDIGKISWTAILFTLPAVFYHFLFETFMEGKTPGKKALHLKVVKLDGREAMVGSYFLRWLFAIVDFTFYGAVAMITYVLTKKGQRLGDVAAGTTVIKEISSEGFLQNQNPGKFDNYSPTFFQAEDMDEEHARLIREVLKTNSRSHIHAMAKKTRDILEIKSGEMPDSRFLMTVMRDYEYFSSQE